MKAYPLTCGSPCLLSGDFAAGFSRGAQQGHLDRGLTSAAVGIASPRIARGLVIGRVDLERSPGTVPSLLEASSMIGMFPWKLPRGLHSPCPEFVASWVVREVFMSVALRGTKGNSRHGFTLIELLVVIAV